MCFDYHSGKLSPGWLFPDSADRSPAQDPPRHSRCQSSDRQWKRAARDSARTLLPGSPFAWIRPSLIFLLPPYYKPIPGQGTNRGLSPRPVLSRLLYEPLRERHAKHRETRERGNTMQHILITGGTGTLGRLIVPRLRDAGCKVRVLSRRSREAGEGIEFVTGDLATGEGIEASVEGAEIIVHCAGSSKGDEDKALNLVRAASRAGARHLVYISVVGADRIPVGSFVDRAMFSYFASKLAAEHVVADSGLPWTTLRATQFHDSILTVARAMAKLPVVPVPAGFRFQPVDADDVAARLSQLPPGEPSGLGHVPSGPPLLTLARLLRGDLRPPHRPPPVLAVSLTCSG